MNTVAMGCGMLLVQSVTQWPTRSWSQEAASKIPATRTHQREPAKTRARAPRSVPQAQQNWCKALPCLDPGGRAQMKLDKVHPIGKARTRKARCHNEKNPRRRRSAYRTSQGTRSRKGLKRKKQKLCAESLLQGDPTNWMYVSRFRCDMNCMNGGFHFLKWRR